MLHNVAWILVPVAIVIGLYCLHRLALYLEKKDLLYYNRRPAGGGSYNPLHEIVQPNYHHVVEVGDQRTEHDDEGEPPVPGG